MRTTWAQMTPDQQAAIIKGIAQASSVYLAEHATTSGAPAVASLGNYHPGASGSVFPAMVTGSYPIFKAKNPTNGDRYAIFANFTGGGAVTLTWKDVQDAFDDAWDGLVELVTAIVNFAGKVLSDLGSLACGILGKGAGAVAASAAGVPPQVGINGATIAQGAACGAPPVVPGAASSSWFLPVAIIGGAAVLAVLLMPHHKKKPKAATAKPATAKVTP